MAKNNRANTELSSGLLSSFETGSSYVLDAATYRADQIAERQSGAKVPYSPFTLEPEVSGFDKTASFPAKFLVGGKTVTKAAKAPKGPACGSLLVFSKEGVGRPWKIVLEPSTNAKGLPHLATRGGYLRRLSDRQARAASGLARKVSAALIREETTGELGPFTKADFNGSCWQLPNPRSDLVTGEAAGYTARDLYSPLSPSDTSSFALTGGRTLVVFTIKFTDELEATNPSLPVRWTHVPVRKDPAGAWTYLLGTGRYLVVKEEGQLQVAAVLAPQLNSYRILGAYYGITSLTGRRDRSRVKSSGPPGTLAAFRTK
jgi:hypothetical protein